MTTKTIRPHLPKERQPRAEHNGGTYWPAERPDVCIIEGKGYVVKMGAEQIDADGNHFRQLVTVCIGPVDEKGNPADAPATTPATRENAANPVTPANPIELPQPADVTPLDALSDVDRRVMELSGTGMGTRAVARTLRAEGTVISHMTVARKVKHNRQTVMF